MYFEIVNKTCDSFEERQRITNQMKFNCQHPWLYPVFHGDKNESLSEFRIGHQFHRIIITSESGDKTKNPRHDSHKKTPHPN